MHQQMPYRHIVQAVILDHVRIGLQGTSRGKYAIVQGQLALFLEEHDACRRDQLGNGSHAQQGRGRHRDIPVSHAITLGIQEGIVTHDAEGSPFEVPLLHIFPDLLVQPVEDNGV